ncbi:hypothetical protein HRbin19_00133 [bacterium HR19]|nr:hypothetical protein HRbin19_00133 [bacterium HR19]
MSVGGTTELTSLNIIAKITLSARFESGPAAEDNAKCKSGFLKL